MKFIRYFFILPLAAALFSCSQNESGLVTRKIQLQGGAVDVLLKHLGYQDNSSAARTGKILGGLISTPSAVKIREAKKAEIFKTWFQSLGISFKRNHEVKYDESDNTLILTHALANIKRIEKELCAFATEPYRVKISLRVIRLPILTAEVISKNLASRITQELDESCLKLIKDSLENNTGLILFDESASAPNGEPIRLINVEPTPNEKTQEKGFVLDCKPHLAKDDNIAEMTAAFEYITTSDPELPSQLHSFKFVNCFQSHQDTFVCLASYGPFSTKKAVSSQILVLLKSELELSSPL
jgi:hypothetical protein